MISRFEPGRMNVPRSRLTLDRPVRTSRCALDPRFEKRLVRVLPSRLVYRQNHSTAMIAMPVLFSSTAARSDTSGGRTGPGPAWLSISLTRASNDRSSWVIKGRPNSGRPLYIASTMHIIESQTTSAAVPGDKRGYRKPTLPPLGRNALFADVPDGIPSGSHSEVEQAVQVDEKRPFRRSGRPNSPEVLGLYLERPLKSRGRCLAVFGRALRIQRLEGSRFCSRRTRWSSMGFQSTLAWKLLEGRALVGRP